MAISRMIFAASILQWEMKDNIDDLPEEEMEDSLGRSPANESTREFLKRLEIRQKIIQRMIDPDLARLQDEPGMDDQTDRGKPDTMQSE